MANPAGQFQNLMGLGIWASRVTTVLGAAGAHTIFTIAGGPIIICGIYGIVTILMDGTASTLRLEHSVGNTNLCADLAAIANDPVGTVYTMSGIITDPMVKAEPGTTGCVNAANPATPVVAVAGNIQVTNGGDRLTASIQWNMFYLPLDPAVVITMP